MKQVNRDHRKHSHSRFSLKRGKKTAGRSGYVYVAPKKTVQSFSEKEIPADVQVQLPEVRPAEKAAPAKKKRLSMRQKSLEKERLAREKRAERMAETAEQVAEASSEYESVRTDFSDSHQEIRENIRKLKEAEKEKKRNLREAKRNLRKSRKENRKAKKKHLGVVTSIITTLLVTLGTLLLAVVLWLIRTWPRLRMEELIYQLNAPIAGTGTNMITAFIKQAVVPASLAMLGTILILIFATRRNKFFRRTCKVLLTLIAAFCTGVAGTIFWEHLDVGTYVENQTTSSDFIKTEYVDPNSTQLTFPETKRNLIYIYLESTEVTFADKANGGALDQNVMPRLTELSKTNENFSGTEETLNGGHSLPNTTWTMGGLFGATSGLPLQTDVSRNTMDTQSSFFPGITTLGDILAEEGYTQVFACGSPAAYGGRELYFESHGNYTMHDYYYARDKGIIPYGYYVWWGFEDRRLINMAKDDLTNLAASGRPFNYTMLTADTHFEDGYLDWGAENKFNDRYSNVIFNSDKEVTEFVSWCQQQSWYANTTIVLSGDHPTMDSDYLNDIDPDYDRTVYTTYINSAVENTNTKKRVFSTLDNFPTTLAAMGVQIEGDRLGLGTNLFSSKSTLLEEVGLEKETAELNKKSTFMSTLAATDNNTAEFQEYLEENGIQTSTVRLKNYDPETQKAVLSIDDIFYLSGEADYLSVKVTHPDGKQDIVRASHKKKGSYEATVDVSNGGIASQSIQVDAHVRLQGSDALKSQKIYSYGGNLCLISQGTEDLAGMAHGLQFLDQSRYAIMITTQGNALNYLDEESRTELMDLGFPKTFLEGNENTRYAVFTQGGTLMREGTGYIRDYEKLPNGTNYAISSADSAGAYATISIGGYYNNYTNYKDGFHIVVYDMAGGTVVSQFDYDTANRQFGGNLFATYDEENDTVKFTVTEAYNINEGPLEVKVALWDKKDIDHKIELSLSSNDNSTFETTIERENHELENLYAVAYVQSRKSNWHRFAEGYLDEIIETSKEFMPTASPQVDPTEGDAEGNAPALNEEG